MTLDDKQARPSAELGITLISDSELAADSNASTGPPPPQGQCSPQGQYPPAYPHLPTDPYPPAGPYSPGSLRAPTEPFATGASYAGSYYAAVADSAGGEEFIFLSKPFDVQFRQEGERSMLKEIGNRDVPSEDDFEPISLKEGHILQHDAILMGSFISGHATPLPLHQHKGFIETSNLFAHHDEGEQDRLALLSGVSRAQQGAGHSCSDHHPDPTAEVGFSYDAISRWMHQTVKEEPFPSCGKSEHTSLQTHKQHMKKTKTKRH